ncbi:MAG TPA: aspartate aminotransferase family protein [Burkholderiales bacterium]|nr:aspartate aminotransferase family protein [Burkholderiales bacterium]
MPVFAPLPIAFASGAGAWLTDVEGREYLDAFSGVAVCNLGHSHPEITQAICEQAGKLIHTSNWYEVPAQAMLAERLCKLAKMENVFFSNSGAEANEAAIKIARMLGNQRKIMNPGIVVMEGSFHGRTLATLSASGNRKIQAGFDPLVQGFYRVPYGDIAAVRQAGDNNKNIVAVLVEPIQGEGGVQIPPPGYLQQLRELCSERNWLLMLDEVQTGMCRTGKWFACEHENVLPDVMTLAKALGNGVPIGACLANGAAAQVFKVGAHGSTFSGTPIASRVALTVCDILDNGDYDNRAAALGTRILDGLKRGLADVPGIVDIRGRGLMLAVELDRPCKELMQLALEEKLLINVTAETVVRLLPPLILKDTEADQIVERLVRVLKKYAGRP